MTEKNAVLTVEDLLENNRNWSEGKTKVDPDFFNRLSDQQSPKYLWIGCSDSRVPANDIVGMDPGELFVHRNVANLVVPADINCLSVLQYSTEVLKVEHIIVCGHYGCGGVMAAMGQAQMGLIDQWIWPIKALYARNKEEIDALGDDKQRADRLCELNVMEQVSNLTKTTLVQNAWHRGQKLSLHGWIYGLKDGLVRDLGVTVTSNDGVTPALRYDPK
ncbi:carbonate dehydratase [Rhodovibrionaceae bacterium A322]